MPEEDDHSDHNHEPFLRGIALPIPAGLGAALAHAHDREHIEAESMQQRIYAFLDSLNVEQLMSLRKMLAMDGKSQLNNYWEGMVVTILRRIHHVDPDSGLTAEQALAQMATESGTPPHTP